MGRYGQSLDLGRELENEAAQEEARKAQENPPKPEPVIVVTPAEEKKVEEPVPEEPDEPEEAPRPPDPGEEDVVEMLSKHVPHASAPKKRSRGWVWLIAVIVLGTAVLFFARGGADAAVQGEVPLATIVVPAVSESVLPNVSTAPEDALARILAEGLQDASSS